MSSLFLALGLIVSTLADAMQLGSLECPCLTSSSPVFSSVQAALVTASSANISASYGLEGCKAYDLNNSPLIECVSSNPPSYCSSLWCYVDADKCRVDKAKCEAAGGSLGSGVSPYCRTRQREQSIFLSNSSFSYQTCGFLDTYSPKARTEEVAGHVIRAAVAPWEPWVIKTSGDADSEQFSGAMYDFAKEVLDSFQPRPTLEIIPGWATNSSRELFPANTYTACAHDVAVGNRDICIADYWRTPERIQMSEMTPAVRQDRFYLIVPAEVEKTTFWKLLEKPFAPFTATAWGLIGAFICGMAVLLHLMALWKQRARVRAMGLKAGIVWNLRGIYNAFLSLWLDFLSQSGLEKDSSHVPKRAWKFFKFSWSFFLLIIIASYTASLASLLVVQAADLPSIPDMDTAMKKHVRVCAPKVLQGPMQKLYPGMKDFVFVDTYELYTIPRKIYAGTCAAAIVSLDFIESMHSGLYKQLDCDAVSKGDLSASDAHCETGFEEEARSDCNLIRTGEILFTYPIAWPISSQFAHSVSWAVTSALAEGIFEKVKRANSEYFPKSECAVSTLNENEEGLGVWDLSGTIIVSTFFFLIAIFCFLQRIVLHWIKTRCHTRLAPEWYDIGRSKTPCEHNDATTGDAKVRISELENDKAKAGSAPTGDRGFAGESFASTKTWALYAGKDVKDILEDIAKAQEEMTKAKAESDAALKAYHTNATGLEMALCALQAATKVDRTQHCRGIEGSDESVHPQPFKLPMTSEIEPKTGYDAAMYPSIHDAATKVDGRQDSRGIECSEQITNSQFFRLTMMSEIEQKQRYDAPTEVDDRQHSRGIRGSADALAMSEIAEELV